MNKRKWAGIAAAVLLSTGIGVKVSAATTELDESTLGGVAIEGLDRKEAQQAVSEEIATWMSGNELLLKSKYETQPIERKSFKFQIDASLNDYYDKTKRSWSTFFLKPKPQEVPLIVTVNKKELELPETVDVDKTVDRALEAASMLSENEPSLVYTTDPKNMLAPIGSVSYKAPAGTNTAALLQMTEQLNEKVIQLGGTFSLLDEVKVPDELRDRTAELSMLGSAIYELALDTDMQIAEHHSQPEVPKYGRPGVEAAIDQKSEKDLILVNSNRRSYIIQANMYGDSLDMSLEALPSDETYTYELKNEKPLVARTVYRYTPYLPPGYEEVEEEGDDGKQVDVYRIHKAADGGLIDEKLVSKSAYLPQPKIVLTSSQKAKAESTDNNNSNNGGNSNINNDMKNNVNTDSNSGSDLDNDYWYYDLDYDWYYDRNGDFVRVPSTGSGGSPTAPGTGKTTPGNSGSDSGSTTTPAIPKDPVYPTAPAEMKKVLLDSLREECMKSEPGADKQRCDRESEVVAEWLLKYLMENDFGNSNSGQNGKAPVTKSPDLNGILKGLK